MYNVNEGDGLVDNLVFVEKQDGRASEQTLPVDVSLQFISALGMHNIKTIWLILIWKTPGTHTSYRLSSHGQILILQVVFHIVYC